MTKFEEAESAWKPLESEFVKQVWQPEYLERYYFPSFQSLGWYESYRWQQDEYDERVKQVVGIYKTPLEAQAKARELGWLK